MNRHVGVSSVNIVCILGALLRVAGADVTKSSRLTQTILQHHHDRETVDDILKKLHAALVVSDGAAVLRITDELRRPFIAGADEVLMATSVVNVSDHATAHINSLGPSDNGNKSSNDLSLNKSAAKGFQVRIKSNQSDETLSSSSSAAGISTVKINRSHGSLSDSSNKSSHFRQRLPSLNSTSYELSLNSSTKGFQVKVKSNQTEKTLNFNSSMATSSQVKLNRTSNFTSSVARGSQGEMSKGKSNQAKGILANASGNAVQSNTKRESVSSHESNVCVFDDTLFSLTKYAKAELAEELKKPEMQKAVSFVRRGGWRSCAVEGKNCMCVGEVRFVDVDRRPFQGTSNVNTESYGGILPCEGKSFGLTNRVKVAWPSADVATCECRSLKSAEDKSPGDGFHLENRLSSESRLQEAWVFLFRLLSKSGQMPLGTGDPTFQGIENWGARAGKQEETFLETVPERFWITKYVREIAGPAIAGPKCLEWGNPKKPGQGFTYANLVSGCTEKYDMQYDYVYWQHVGMHVTGNVVHSDILSLPTVLGDLRMDAIFATQVFEHLAEPIPAAEALFQALAPGGVLVFTAPQSAQFHKVPHDYHRYTIEGTKYLLVRAGFCVPNSAFAGGGDFVFDAGRDAGLQIQDYSMEEVENAFQLGYDKVSHGAITIHALAFKPPHASCMDPTAGWEELKREGIRA